MPKKDRTRTHFDFCGEILLSNKRGLVEHKTFETNRGTSEKAMLNFAVKNGGSRVFVTAQGFKGGVIRTYTKDGTQIAVDWEDRFVEDIVSDVIGSRKYYVNLTERKEFLTTYDMIEYLGKEIPNFMQQGGKNVLVSGTYTVTYRNGKYRESYNVERVYAANESDKPQLQLDIDLFYGKGDLDKSTAKDESKMYLTAYAPFYVGRDEGYRYLPIPTPITLNLTKYPIDSAIYNNLIQYLDIEQKGTYAMRWKLDVINGVEEVAWDETCLTEKQRESVELGLAKIDSFRPKGPVYGSQTRELRITSPDLNDQYRNGLVEVFPNREEFEERIYHPSQNETKAQVEAHIAVALEDKSSTQSQDPIAEENLADESMFDL